MATFNFGSVKVWSASIRPDGSHTVGFNNFQYTSATTPLGTTTSAPTIAAGTTLDSLHWVNDGSPESVDDLLQLEIPASDILANIPSDAVISSIFATWTLGWIINGVESLTPNGGAPPVTPIVTPGAESDLTILPETIAQVFQDLSSNTSDGFLHTHEYVTAPPVSRAFLLATNIRRFDWTASGGQSVTAVIGPSDSYTAALSASPQWGLMVSYLVTYTVPPKQLTITPSVGPTAGGTRVTITGSDFDATPTVTFDGVPATDVQFVNSAEINCLTPAHAAGSVDVVVTNPGGLACTLPLSFTYVATPPGSMLVDQMVLEIVYPAPLYPTGGGGIPRGPGECAGVGYGIGVVVSPGAIAGTGDLLSTVAVELKQFFGGALGAPPPLGFLYCFAAGSSTLQDTFTNSSLVTANLNPIQLDADGNPPNPIFLAPAIYKFDLRDADNVSLPGFPIDNIAGSVWPGQVLGAVTANPAANEEGIAHALSGTINKAGSGTHPVFALLKLLAPTIGAGAASLTEAATFYVAGPPLGGTTRYAVHIVQGDVLITDSASKIGFFGKAPAVQQLMATGTGKTVDNVITALQTLGLFKQA